MLPANETKQAEGDRRSNVATPTQIRDGLPSLRRSRVWDCPKLEVPVTARGAQCYEDARVGPGTTRDTSLLPCRLADLATAYLERARSAERSLSPIQKIGISTGSRGYQRST